MTQSTANKTSKNKLVKASFGYIVGNYLLKGISFISVPIFARLLSKEDFGVYNTFIAYESIAFVIIGLAIHSSYKNAYLKYKDNPPNRDFRTYVSSSMVLIVLSFLSWMLIANIIGSKLIEWISLTRTELNLLLIFSCSTAIITCYNSDVGIYYDYKGFLKISAFNALTNIGFSIILICTVFDGMRYMGRIIGTVIPAAIAALYVILRNYQKAKPGNYKEFWEWGVGYSLPIVPHGISQVLLSQFDRIMIMQMIGAAEAGVYSFAFTINLIIFVTANSLETVWLQWFYEKMSKKDIEGMRTYNIYFIVGIAIFTSLLILVAPELIYILGGEKYQDAIYCTIPVIIGGYFTFLYKLPAAVEYYYEKTSAIATATIMAAIINVVLNMIFIPKYGYIAAAYTTVFAYMLYFLFHCIMSKKIQGKFIFSVPWIFIAVAAVALVSALTYLNIGNLILRFTIAFIIFSLAIIYEEKNFCFIRKYILKKNG